MKKIFLCLICLNLSVFADFIRSSNNTVFDTETNLEWQDSRLSSLSWKDAIDYCNNLSLAGGNWRLPNINELQSLYLHNKFNQYKAVFQSKGRIFHNFWSSTTAIYFKDYYGKKYTDYAYISGGSRFIVMDVSYKKNREFVRCVRGTPQ